MWRCKDETFGDFGPLLAKLKPEVVNVTLRVGFPRYRAAGRGVRFLWGGWTSREYRENSVRGFPCPVPRQPDHREAGRLTLRSAAYPSAAARPNCLTTLAPM